MRGMLAICTAVVAVGFPIAALACSDVFVVSGKRSQSEKTCSFGGFGLDRNYSGKNALDIGGGRIGQLIVANESCPYLEKVLFVDCNTGESVTVDGVIEPDLQRKLDQSGAKILGGDYLIKYLQPPTGPLALTSETTVEAVIEVSEREGFGFSTEVLRDFETHNQAVLEHNKIAAGYGEPLAKRIVSRARRPSAHQPFDTHCGCKLFYPDSPGANS
jgi:hypothetical protein